ncbi:glycohydrolase toxin TNT-related protein [Leifsonia sp. NPDC014704]|uniref:glycohydrolase toxin TNT-related protein n=1 Tax=Leifsonia sp. NPDC014704 TaxID=3364123 RepID=UPI0036F46A4B
MSVVEFSADAWQASSPGLQTGIAGRMEAVGQLQQGLEALAASEKVSGQGADAMRAYIGEVHVPIVQLLQLGLSTFHTAIGVYWAGYGQVDSGGNFRLVRDEFQAHLAQLEGGMEQLRGFATQLRGIAADASHLVSLGGAGAGAVEQTVNDLQGMHAIAKGQKETWEAYEASDPGFGQVKDLIAQLAGIVNNVGALTVGQGRSYTAGSFTLTLQQLGPLTSGMLDYCTQNQKAATAGWESMFSGYAKDIEAAEAARREQAGWDLIWDGLQIVAGAVVTVIGLGLTPFTGGVSLGLTLLGGSLLIGGINNAINHASIATTGNELNLVGMAGQAVDEWWTANAVKPAAASGSWGLEFLAGVGSGVVHVISDAGQFSVHEAGMGVTALFTDPRAWAQAWDQITTTVGQVAAFNPSVMGELAGALLPGAAALKAARAAGVVGKAGELAGGLGKTVKIVEPGKAVSAPSRIRAYVGAVAADIKSQFTAPRKAAWVPHPDTPSKPSDKFYGQPKADHGVHRPYPTINDVSRSSFDLVSDPAAPWGRAPNDTPYTKAEYEERFTEAKTDPITGDHWDRYPPNDGAVPGTRRDYRDLAAYIRDWGSALDRIGKDNGNFLGVMRDGQPASFEQRSLPVNSLEQRYHSYRLAEEWPPGTENWSIEHSKIARAFGRPGGGHQVLVRDQEGNKVTVKKLLDRGVLMPGGLSK